MSTIFFHIPNVMLKQACALIIVFFIMLCTPMVATFAVDNNDNASESSGDKSFDLRKRFVPKENYKLQPSTSLEGGITISPRPRVKIQKTKPLQDLLLAEGQPVPVPLEPERAFIGNIYEIAYLEDGRKVVIETNTRLETNAYISEKGKRAQFIPNGHYELREGVLTRLPQNQYTMTDDTSILISIYKGEVINYVPRWAVKAGRFVPFELVSKP